MAKVPLKGSERAAAPGARVLAPAEATERLEVSVILRRRGLGEMQSRVAALASGGRSRGVMSRDEFARVHGADPADISAVRAFAAAHGLAVVEEHAARRTVMLAGTVAQFCSAFSVQLHRMTHAGGTYRGRTGEILLPPELAGVVEAILGLDNRPQAAPHFRIRPPGDAVNSRAAAPRSVSFNPTQIAELYGFPAGSADPATGYNVRVDGADTVIGGTSAVAPLWAGLVARINGINGRPAGFLNPQLYANPGALRDVTQGNNGDFRASAGWDACTGLGSPLGDALVSVL